MLTPSTVLQELRRTLVKEESQSFQDYKIKALCQIANEINFEIDKKLIEAIVNKPSVDTWNIFILFRRKYGEFFANINDYLAFIKANIQPIEGFTSTVSNNICRSTDSRYPFSYICITFKEA